MSVVKINTTSEGLAYDWLSVDIVQEVNRIPYAELVLLDGTGAPPQFKLSNTDDFAPGNEIEIRLMGEEGEKQTEKIFQGLVVKHKIETNSEGSRLTIELKDPAFKLTRGRKSKVYENAKDSEIISQIVKEAQLKVVMAPTRVEHKEMVQYNCTDWDFVLSRTDVNGQMVFTANGQLTIKAPTLTGPTNTFSYEDTDIHELEMEVDASEQQGAIKSYAWNIADQNVNKPPVNKPSEEAAEFALAQGNKKKLDVKDLAKKIGAKEYTLSSIISADAKELQTWIDAKEIRERLSLLKGSLTVEGRDISPGDVITIKNIADRFDGDTIVTAVRHKVDHNGWKTYVQFGLSADWYAQQYSDIIDVPAAGLLPAIQGLQVGIVEGYYKDPQEQFRVRVKIPALNPEGGGKGGIVWARLMAIDAGGRRGVYFYPEPGDEVVVDFFNNDPRQAVILGSMHSASKSPPFDTTKDNWEKGIVTKKGVMVAFDDENIALKLGNKNDAGDEKQIILIDQKAQKIMIADSINKNTMILGKKGVQISCEKDINIEAKGNVTIKGKIVDIN